MRVPRHWASLIITIVVLGGCDSVEPTVFVGDTSVAEDSYQRTLSDVLEQDALLDTQLAGDSVLPDALLDSSANDGGAADGELPGELDVSPLDTSATQDVPGPLLGTSIPPFGIIEGPCAELVSEVAELEPSVFSHTFVFSGAPFDEVDLSSGGTEMFFEENAGGSSKCSEVFSYEVVSQCLDALLYKTETEIVYDTEGAITDYVVTLDASQRVGVSVTRAYKGPILEYSLADAIELLEKKLDGVNDSSDNVSDSDAWVKQILHVWTLQPDWVGTVQDAWNVLAPEYLDNTIVLITLETGSDFVTTNTCED
jgi:hypothetical protein